MSRVAWTFTFAAILLVHGAVSWFLWLYPETFVALLRMAFNPFAGTLTLIAFVGFVWMGWRALGESALRLW